MMGSMENFQLLYEEANRKDNSLPGFSRKYFTVEVLGNFSGPYPSGV